VAGLIGLGALLWLGLGLGVALGVGRWFRYLREHE